MQIQAVLQFVTND